VGSLGAAGELLDEGCLAAAGLAGHEDDASLPGQCQAQEPIQLSHLALTGDKDWALGTSVWREKTEMPGGRFGCLGERRRAPGLELVVEPPGVLLWGHTQLVSQDLHALIELVQCGGAAAGPGVEAHELLMCLFVERIEGQAPPGVGEGGLELALRAVPVDQPIQRLDKLAAQGLSLEELPIVKVEAVFRAEAAEELAARQRDRLGQGGKAEGTYVRWWVPVACAGAQEAAELHHVYPEGMPWREVRGGVEGDFVTVGIQPGCSEGGTQGMQGSAEGGVSAGGVKIGPEQVDQGITAVALGGDGEEGKQGERLAPVQLEDGLVDLDAGRTQEKDGQAGHLDTSLVTSIPESGREVNEIRACQANCNGFWDGSATEPW
jgi:hypothetical protein